MCAPVDRRDLRNINEERAKAIAIRIPAFALTIISIEPRSTESKLRIITDPRAPLLRACASPPAVRSSGTKGHGCCHRLNPRRTPLAIRTAQAAVTGAARANKASREPAGERGCALLLKAFHHAAQGLREMAVRSQSSVARTQPLFATSAQIYFRVGRYSDTSGLRHSPPRSDVRFWPGVRMGRTMCAHPRIYNRGGIPASAGRAAAANSRIPNRCACVGFRPSSPTRPADPFVAGERRISSPVASSSDRASTPPADRRRSERTARRNVVASFSSAPNFPREGESAPCDIRSAEQSRAAGKYGKALTALAEARQRSLRSRQALRVSYAPQRPHLSPVGEVFPRRCLRHHASAARRRRTHRFWTC